MRRTLLDSPTHLKLTTRFAAVSLVVEAEENRAQSSWATQSHSSMQAPRCSYRVIKSDAPDKLTMATRWDESGEKDKWVTRGGGRGVPVPVEAAAVEGTGTGSETRTRGVAASAPAKWVKRIDGVVGSRS